MQSAETQYVVFSKRESTLDGSWPYNFKLAWEKRRATLLPAYQSYSEKRATLLSAYQTYSVPDL